MSSNLNIETAFRDYISGIGAKYKHVVTSEMGYRTEFEVLMKEVFNEIGVRRIDHDAKSFKGNKPDYVIFKEVPILYIEVKDIGVSLDKIEKSEQMSRYFGYENLVLSDYVEFRFYRNGLRYEDPIIIGDVNKKDRTITPRPEQFQQLANTLVDFTKSHKEPIKSGLQLAKIMGGKAQRIRDNIQLIFTNTAKRDEDLQKVYETIKQLLIHDLDPEGFADMYAQTLVYGLFVARFHDESPDNFTRSEARELIPASNPFLRHFFDHIAGPNFNKSLEYIVNELCEVFSHSDVEKLMDDYYRRDKYGESQKGPDAVIHFYEDFLKEYDPELRKKMGAYYTPEPVVQFIVRSVDQILKRDFGLSAGLADTSKTENGVHKVQVLDPATGTGTFYSKVIGHIYKDFVKKGQTGRWPTYVHNDLLPRIHGFELMMAAYTIAHLKLSMAFKKTGFKYFNDRLGIYLTNSLEDVAAQQDLFAFGFAESIANESKEAAKIKKETPIMVVVGNPPYSVSSQNKGTWIQNLIADYKNDLNERNIQPLSDDYIKFIRFAEHFVEKNKSGIVAMITNNSFIDGIIHRQMRKHLLETFDDIYILDLHGNSKKKETAPDGSKDENVFNIMQGVSINIFVKKDTAQNNIDKKALANVYFSELFGKRQTKFDFLNENDVESIKWNKLDYSEPQYFFVQKNFNDSEEYEKGFKVDELFLRLNAGTATGKDSLLTGLSTIELIKSLQGANTVFKEDDIRDYLYRPFDIRKIIYDNKLVQRLRKDIMDHMIRSNIALITCKQETSFDFQHSFATTIVADRCSISLQTGEVGYILPLYLYSPDGTKTPNFNQEIAGKITESIGDYTPEELFDYIYAVLHSPTYREKYKEFLKIDFPRVPYPTDRKMFDSLVKVGTELRKIHLMESERLENFITTYPETGTDKVEFAKYKERQVWINETQYFGNVPEIAWNFYIGGYQPAQKWLKDRKGRQLANEDITHYQKIIVALVETDKLMKEVDELRNGEK